MKIFDCNISYGFNMMPEIINYPDISSLLKDMDKQGIDKCMLRKASAIFGNSSLCNRELVDDIKAHSDRLYGVATYRPNLNSPDNSPLKWAESIRENNIKGVYFYPSDYEFNIDLLGGYFDYFNQMRLPILLEFAYGFGFAYRIDYKALSEFLSHFPNTPIILMNAGMMNDCEIFSLAENYENFYLESSGFQGNMAVEEFVGRFGSKRLLFGSRAPFLSPVPMIGKMYYSELEREQKEDICYNNMKRLVLGVKYD